MWNTIALYVSIDLTLWCNCSNHQKSHSVFAVYKLLILWHKEQHSMHGEPKETRWAVCAVHFMEVFDPVPSITTLFTPHTNCEIESYNRTVYCGVWRWSVQV